jgi:hypothetical protein
VITDDKLNPEVLELVLRLENAHNTMEEVDHLLQWGKVFEARQLIEFWRNNESERSD